MDALVCGSTICGGNDSGWEVSGDSALSQIMAALLLKEWVGLASSGEGDIGNGGDAGSGGDGIWGSGDECDVSGDGLGDGNGNVAAIAAISASVDVVIGGCSRTVIVPYGYQSGVVGQSRSELGAPPPHPHPRPLPRHQHCLWRTPHPHPHHLCQWDNQLDPTKDPHHPPPPNPH
ncbi:hypothetical protein Tco_1077339 [Tanacetum coccineum]